jgi:hypothetical protein
VGKVENEACDYRSVKKHEFPFDPCIRCQYVSPYLGEKVIFPVCFSGEVDGKETFRIEFPPIKTVIFSYSPEKIREKLEGSIRIPQSATSASDILLKVSCRSMGWEREVKIGDSPYKIFVRHLKDYIKQ